MINKKPEGKAKTVLANLVSNNGNLKEAARAAEVGITTAKKFTTPAYIEKHPEVKDWYEKNYTAEDLAIGMLKAETAKLAMIPNSMIVSNPAMATVKLKAIELGMKSEGVLTENKNINVSITDYTEQLKEAWRLREQRLLKDVTLESKNYLPAPANSGGQPSEEQKGS